jgi:hypothetical protein
VGLGVAEAIDGSYYWDDQYGAFFVYYDDGSGAQWVQVSPGTSGSTTLNFPAGPVGGQQYVAPNGVTYVYNSTKTVWALVDTSVKAATLAEAAAGVTNDKYSSPETAVPKDAAGMTGAALIPTGAGFQRPGAPVNGMMRFNTDLGAMEAYVAAIPEWKEIAYKSKVTPFPGDQTWSGAYTAPGVVSVGNLTITDGSVITPAGSGTFIIAYGSVNIGNSIFFNYDSAGVVGTGNYSSTGDRLEPYPGLGGAPGTPDASMSGTVPFLSFNPGSGGSGVKETTTSARSTPFGGSAGGVLVIYALGNITVGSGCIFNANGGNAQNSSSGQFAGGGGGGGAGGTIVLQSFGNLTVGPSSFTANGGRGGNGLAVAGLTHAKGGGGGGAGYVVFGCTGGYNVTPSVGNGLVTLNGGAGGSRASNGSGVRACGGAGNAGRGGAANGNATAQAGENGIFLNLFYLI